MFKRKGMGSKAFENLKKKMQYWYSKVSQSSHFPAATKLTLVCLLTVIITNIASNQPELDKQPPLGQVLDQARPLVGSTPGSPTPSWTT